MYRGKGSVFDAVTVHLDEVETHGARHHGAGGERAVRRAGGRDRGRRRGRLGHAVSSGVFARRHGGDRAPLRIAADARRLLRRRGGARRITWPTSRRSTATPDNKPLAWRYGIDETVLDRACARPRSRTGSRIRCCRGGRARKGRGHDHELSRSSCGGDRRHRRARHRGGRRTDRSRRDLSRALSQRGRGAAFPASRQQAGLARRARRSLRRSGGEHVLRRARRSSGPRSTSRAALRSRRSRRATRRC